MPKLTQKFIEHNVRRPTHGQIFYRDTELRGFALRVTHGSMSYVVECRVNGVTRRITIGPHGPLSPEFARREAQKLLASMTTGHDPRIEEWKHRISNVTLGEVLEKYLATRTLRPNSIRSCKQIVARCLGDWLNKPICSITRDMVESRHRELTRVTKQGTSGKAQANIAMERLGILINFAMNVYEIDGQPIIQSNPVRRLSQMRAWHKLPRRQTIIPDHKLHSWYQAVLSLRSKVTRDYLLLVILTGLRRNEAATLRWTDIDFESRVLTVRGEIAKNHQEHRLPMSDFIFALLSQRRAASPESEFVFPGREKNRPMVDPGHMVALVVARSGCNFVIHDLRRVFLTTAEKLEVPHYFLKKLANHVSAADVTSGYIVVHVERQRQYMSKISEHLVLLMGANVNDLVDPHDTDTQLQAPERRAPNV